MSPEQVRGGEVDARSDLYALGCVGYHALSGRVPFAAATPTSILSQHLAHPAPPLLSVAPHVPACVASAVDRCLRKEPERRFSSAGTFAEALGPEARADRELPVPLRVFIKQNRAWEGALAWSVLGLFVAVPALLGSLVAGARLPAAVWALLFVSCGSFPLLKLLRDVRRILRAGFTLDDVTAAFAQDIELKDEEFRFEVGSRVNMTDTVIRWVKRFGLAGAAVAVALALLGMRDWPTFGLFAWSLLNTLVASEVEEIRARGRADVEGERWLGLWRGWIGKALFRISGIGLKRVAPAVSGVHRATEVALGLAADRLFEELPKEVRRGLGELPGTVRALEDDAQAMRRHVVELDAVLAEIGDDDPSHPGAEDRGRVRAAVEATRDEAREKLRQAVRALETIRLGLLLLHGGGGTVERLTQDLSSAREISGALSDLLAGHQDVARLLEARRTTGRFTIPGLGSGAGATVP
jgi:serine/threonine-protein kinase